MSDPTPQPAPRCPECGTPTAEVAPRAPWWYRRRRLFQAIGLLAFVTFLGVMQWRHPLIAPNVHNVPPGTHSTSFPTTPFTRADIEAMAADGTPAGDGDRLVRSITEWTWHWSRGDLGFQAAFISPAGEGSIGYRWGWPVKIVSRNYSATYEDAFARTGMTAPNLRGRLGWMYDAWWDEGQHPVFGRWTLLVTPDRIGAAVGVVVLAWLVGALAARACERFLPRARRRRWRRLLPAACALMMLGVVVTLSARRQAWESYIPAAPPWPRTGDTGLTLADLWALRGKDGADRVVARAILSGADSVPATGEHFAWGWRWPIAHSSRQIMGLWPHSVFDGHAWDIHPLDGSENSAWTRTRWAAQFTRGNFVIFRKEVGGLDRFRQYTLSLSPMSWCLLGLLGAWLAPAIPIRLTMWHRRRRDRRRVARGQCVRCGYEGVRPARLAAASPARG